MALGAEDEQAARRHHRFLVGGDLGADAGLAVGVVGVVDLHLDPHVGVAAELDVGAAAGHVGGDGDAAADPGLGYDGCLLLVVAGVEHVVRDLLLVQHRREVLGPFDADGADQHRLAAFAAVEDLLDDRLVLLGCGAVDLVVVVDADTHHVGRNVDDLETVDLRELAGLGHRRPGHPGQLGIEPEIVLEGDRRQRLVFLLDVHAFLGLQRLVKTLGVAPSLHHPAGELVDDDHLVVLDDVVGVQAEQLVGAQRLVGMMHERNVGDIVEIALDEETAVAQHPLHLLDPDLGERHRAGLFVLLVILVGEQRDQLVHPDIVLGRVLGRAGNDQRRPRLVDQDRVDLVDDSVVERPVGHVLAAKLHVVAQIVEAQFVVGAVGDVAGIGLLVPLVAEAVDDASDAETQERVDLPHPFGVALGEVVVDGDHVHPLAGQRVEIDRQGGDQGLALAGLHFRDHAAVQHDAAHQLDVEVALAEGALGRFANGGEGVDHEVVELFPRRHSFPQPGRAGAQVLVAESFQRRLQRVDRLDVVLQAFQESFVGGAEHAPSDSAEHQ